MQIKLNISNITNNQIAVGDLTVEVNYTTEELIAVIEAYKDLIPVVVNLLQKENDFNKAAPF